MMTPVMLSRNLNSIKLTLNVKFYSELDRVKYTNFVADKYDINQEKTQQNVKYCNRSFNAYNPTDEHHDNPTKHA